MTVEAAATPALCLSSLALLNAGRAPFLDSCLPGMPLLPIDMAPLPSALPIGTLARPSGLPIGSATPPSALPNSAAGLPSGLSIGNAGIPSVLPLGAVAASGTFCSGKVLVC